LSLVLRHKPHVAGIELDEAGWVAVDALLAGCARAGRAITREQLLEVVATNDKQRFELSADGRRIRASQGHSVAVELGYAQAAPPEVLYHGTASRNQASIRRLGLLKGSRHHVHLSADVQTAADVGGRYGKPVVLTVDAARMHADGFAFFLSANGVWLTEQVPPAYLDAPDGWGQERPT
jgi:putative RNA 2'-phosphotransferase